VSISEGESTSDRPTAAGLGPRLRPAPATTGLPSEQRRLLAGASRTATVQRTLLAADAAAVSVSVPVALIAGSPDGRAAGQLTWGLVYLPVVLVLFNLYGLYDRDRKRVGHSTLDDVPAVFHAALMATLGFWGWLKVAPVERLVLVQAVLLLALTVLLVLAARAGTRRLAHRLIAAERVVLVGAGPTAQLLAQKLRAHRRTALELVGYLSDAAEGDPPPDAGLAHLGSPDDLADACRSRAVDRVLIASPDIDHERLADLVRSANGIRLKVSLLPSAIDVLGPSTELDDLDGLTLLAVNPTHLSWSSRLLKRGLDVTVSAAAMPVLLLLLPVVAAAIKLDSPGPVFFRQERVGRGGRHFHMLKLRTMVSDAEARLMALQEQSAHPAWLLVDRDPRVTRLGGLLRVTSIDELPQLWNVLKGEMSLVGPRPMPLATDRCISGWGRRRLDLAPGITGMWQVLGRTSIPFEDMLKLDYLYVTNWSVWGDVRLLLRTVSVVLSRHGAN
jgi:exopolysaccharide biosynthesis polyprenyl glycosylphosphotransferase